MNSISTHLWSGASFFTPQKAAIPKQTSADRYGNQAGLIVLISDLFLCRDYGFESQPGFEVLIKAKAVTNLERQAADWWPWRAGGQRDQATRSGLTIGSGRRHLGCLASTTTADTAALTERAYP